jgi:hypothetical protein
VRIKYACLYVIVEKLENLLSLPLRAISTSLSPKLAPCECLSVPVRRAHRGCVHRPGKGNDLNSLEGLQRRLFRRGICSRPV